MLQQPASLTFPENQSPHTLFQAFFLNCLPLEIRLTGCPKTSVNNYQKTKLMSFNKTQTRVVTSLHTGHNNQESLTFPKLSCFIIHAVEFVYHMSYRHARNVHLSNSYQLGYKMLRYLTVFHVSVRSSPLWKICT
jgi:hypothetical protein